MFRYKATFEGGVEFAFWADSFGEAVRIATEWRKRTREHGFDCESPIAMIRCPLTNQQAFTVAV